MRDARRRDRRKEIFQIHVQHRRLLQMWRREAEAGAMTAKTMSGGVRRNAVEQVVQDLSLHELQSCLGYLQQTWRRTTSGEPAVAVMM